MTFGEAVEHMRAGGAVTRAGWREHEKKWIAKTKLNMADADWLPFIVMHTKSGKMIPYLASPVDIFAVDWEPHPALLPIRDR